MSDLSDTILGKEFDKDYFERGLASGKSGYDNYRWLPEMTIKFAYKIIKNLDLRESDEILDFGCAKGFLVKALRILDINAYGCDVSEYALKNVDRDVERYCELSHGKIPFEMKFDWTISKDVFEHLDEKELDYVLKDIKGVSDNLFVIVPLGENDRYIIPSYEMDITHKLAKDKDWWEKKFKEQGWNLDRFSYLIKGMKDNWADYEEGNGFFHLKSKN